MGDIGISGTKTLIYSYFHRKNKEKPEVFQLPVSLSKWQGMRDSNPKQKRYNP